MLDDMKSLLFMRHGEPDYKSDTRALTARGVRQAQSVSQQAFDFGFQPQLIISSDLARASQTADAFADIMRQNGVTAKRLADARLREIESWPKKKPGAQGIRAVLSGLDNALQSVAVVSHRDELSQAVYLLTGKTVSFRFANAALMACYEEKWSANVASSLNAFERFFEPKII